MEGGRWKGKVKADFVHNHVRRLLRRHKASGKLDCAGDEADDDGGYSEAMEWSYVGMRRNR